MIFGVIIQIRDVISIPELGGLKQPPFFIFNTARKGRTVLIWAAQPLSTRLPTMSVIKGGTAWYLTVGRQSVSAMDDQSHPAAIWLEFVPLVARGEWEKVCDTPGSQWRHAHFFHILLVPVNPAQAVQVREQTSPPDERSSPMQG